MSAARALTRGRGLDTDRPVSAARVRLPIMTRFWGDTSATGRPTDSPSERTRRVRERDLC
ncbi:hypothetical protein KGM_201260 [Danaus plexippus plexippus]|uniref:Uncharacterized protein n=1 Tax=Danaus plexippus plexippus TaxID=278856 RepID=A0A212EYY0_DANPL|nr:hypothetical protein KGM_201260 [Danaus plexippus plexippus]